MAALCFGTSWSATAPGSGVQLPPQVLLDQLLLRIDRLVEADDLDAAVQTMEEALALAAEHELELPPDFRFEQARVAFAVGLLVTAKESVTAYLTVASREAESYAEAVALLEDTDRILERRDAPECSPLPEGSACWMELTSHPGCYVWNPAPRAMEAAMWAGECSAGFAQDPGTLTWKKRSFGIQIAAYRDRASAERMVRLLAARGFEGYVEGTPAGIFRVRVGQFETRGAARPLAQRLESERFLTLVSLDSTSPTRNGHGEMRHGRMHGHWLWRWPNGQIQEGPYMSGEKHGRWRTAFPDGEVTYEQFVRGVRQEP